MVDSRVYKIIPRTYAKASIKYILGRRKIDSIEEVKSQLQELLDEALRTTIMEVEIWISIKVAKRTGALQESLILVLNKSIPPPSTLGEIRGIRLILGVCAEIEYAQYVNKMPSAWVRHVATWLEHDGSPALDYEGTPIFLDDPRAVGFYHDKMVEYACERLQINVDKARYNFSVS